MYGSGWEVSFTAQAENISVSRAYGSDYATVACKAWIKSVGGSTNTSAKFWIQIAGTWYSIVIPGSNGSSGWYTYTAGTWYSADFSQTVQVGATGGTLSGQVYFRTDDINGPHAESAYKDWSQSYGPKGASTITSVSPTNVQLNTSGTATCTVNFVSYSSSFTHYCIATLVGGTASTAQITIAGGDSIARNAVLTFPTSFINQISTSKTGTAAIALQTYSGNTLIGTSTTNITVTVPNDINPTVTILSVTKVAVNDTYFSGKFCTILDKAKVTWNFTPSYSSPLNYGTVSIGSKTWTNNDGYLTSDTLQSYGQNNVAVAGYDKRGNVGTATTSFNVYQYYAPVLTAKYQQSGSNHTLVLGGRIASVGGSNSTRTLRLAVYKGNTPVSGYTNVNLSSYISSTASGGTYNGYYAISGTYTIPSAAITDIETETYKFVLSLNDVVTTAKSTPTQVTTYSGIPLMTFGAGGTGITVHKPFRFDYPNGYLKLQEETFTSSVHLDNITYTCQAWCNNVTGRPSYTNTYGFFLSFGLMQQYWEYHATGFTPFVRAYTNNKWYPWRCLIDNDWHSDTVVWDNSVDLLNLTKDRNGRYMEVQQTSSSKPANNPFGSVTAIYYRHQFLSYKDNVMNYAMVELREIYPVAGRIWTNVYNVSSWSGWKYLTPS